MKKMIPLMLALIAWGLAENAMALFQVPSDLDFGTVATGQSKTLSVTVTNKAAQSYNNIPVTIVYITVAGDTDVFGLASNNCPNVLNVGASCTASVSFSPHFGDSRKSAYLTIITAQEGIFTIWLHGTGGGGNLSFSRTSIAFGNVAVNGMSTESIQVTNSTDSAVNLAVSSSLVFQTTHNCNPAPAKGSCTINITFKPTQTGYDSRTISVTWTGGAQSISVEGTGTSDDGHTHNDGGGEGGGCFIATAAYGSYFDPHVKILMEFRDKVLLTKTAGRNLVKWYYHASPLVAEYIRGSAFRKACVRLMLFPAVGFCALTLKLGLIPTLILFILIATLSFLAVRRRSFTAM